MADKKKAPPAAPVPPAVAAPRIVAAAAQFTGHGGIMKQAFSREIEQAMSDAVLLAISEGVSIHDSETILKYKQNARRRLVGRFG